MSSKKRPFDWLSVPGSSSSKRPKPQTTSINTSTSQASNSPSPSSSTSVFPPGAPARTPANLSGPVMLSTLKRSMKFLKEGCQVFAPLESAVEDLMEALECVETTMRSGERLSEIASDLYQWPIVLSEYLSSSLPEKMSDCIERLTKVLDEQAKYIQTQQESGKIKRLMESGQEIEGLERCYRRIETSFRQLQADAALSTWKIADDHLKESRLHAMNAAHDARYNSSFSNKIERGPCLENTRKSVLSGIRGWIRDGNDAKIHWTNGMAGTGKTTIAYSVCNELERDGRLGASFFCSRASRECSDVSRILPTIAYQLAELSYPFRSSLCRMLGEKQSIGQYDILVQFENLIQQPLMEVGDTLPSGLVIVIDALDECTYPRPVEMMLDALFHHATDLPVRFFLTSRPEPAIASTFLARDNQSRSILHLHNVEEHFVKADIETYLTVTLARLSLRKDQIKQLAEQAGVLFICAATLARYLLASGIGASTSARLEVVLNGRKRGKNMKDHEIDLLYKTILDGVLREGRLDEDEVELIKHVIWTVVCVREPVTIGTLAALLNVDSELVSAALQPLRSLLNVIEGSEVVSTLHASFPEFMLSSERSGLSLYCNWAAHQEYLARRCFKLMEGQLKFNICGLSTSFQLDKEVRDLSYRVESSISQGLFYTCRFWVKHLGQSSTNDQLVALLNKFLHEQLLFWMEVLNLKGCMGSGAQILAEALEWLTVVGRECGTSEFVRDAQSFVAAFAESSMCQSTPHIYISALPLVARSSKVRQSYWGRTRGLFWARGAADNRQDGAAPVVWQGMPELKSIQTAYSADGTPLALDAVDGGIEGWHASRFASIPLSNILEGHMEGATSVFFSPDGTRIVAEPRNCITQVHNTQINNPFGNQTNEVSSISFSPNNTRIVCGSQDCTIRVWDVHSGTLLSSPFHGHASAVSSVAFSPDGAYIVSGSWDRTIRVWDVQSSTMLGSPFQGHTDAVSSVAFSPDGARIVSGSYDCTIRVWDVHSGIKLGSPFQGHTNWVTAVAFSPDGTRIVSGSYDCIIQVWDIYNGSPLGSPFKGHTKQISCVAFSPDGTCIVSGSLDRTIRVWEGVDVPHPQTTPFGGLNFNASGWLVDSASQALVLWLPEELHDAFPLLPNTLTVSPLVSIKPIWADLLLGTSWAQCYSMKAYGAHRAH